MGAIHHQIDNRNFMTTIAVVNQFGDLLHHKDFLHIIPPRRSKPRENGETVVRPGEQEEQRKHDEDKKAF